jgi:hypothetical protein
MTTGESRLTGEAKLKFSDNGTFTIVQFTDVHNGGGTPEDLRSFAMLEAILREERPDLVVYTGDQIRSRGPDPLAQFRQITSIAEKAGMLYAFIFGNHDSRRNVTRQELMDMESRRPLCLAQSGPEHVSGVGNYSLLVSASRSPEVAAVLYFIDSDRNAPESEVHDGRSEWIDRDKTDWYVRESDTLKRKVGRTLPSLLFCHIPMPEYEEVWNTQPCCGYKFDAVRCPGRNAGLFAAMVEKGDVIGTFAGHDHSNDYCGELKGIRLCYGRVSGFNGKVQEGFQRGARIIRLREGERRFDTWIRLEDGSLVTRQPVHKPERQHGSLCGKA